MGNEQKEEKALPADVTIDRSSKPGDCLMCGDIAGLLNEQTGVGSEVRQILEQIINPPVIAFENNSASKAPDMSSALTFKLDDAEVKVIGVIAGPKGLMCLIEPTSQINAYDTKTYKKIDAPKGTTIYWGLLMLEGSEKAKPIAFYVDPQKEKAQLSYIFFRQDDSNGEDLFKTTVVDKTMKIISQGTPFIGNVPLQKGKKTTPSY